VEHWNQQGFTQQVTVTVMYHDDGRFGSFTYWPELGRFRARSYIWLTSIGGGSSFFPWGL